MRKRVERRRRFTAEQRERMLVLVRGLTGEQAAKKLGIHVMTIYSWRRAAGQGGAPARATRNGSNGDISRAVQAEVQQRVRELLPQIVREEVARALR